MAIAYGRPRPAASRFELFAWLFMRLSGLALLFLAIGHLVIMHLINNVDVIDYCFVVNRWTGAYGLFWRAWDGSLLYLAMLHGLNGLRTVIDDYFRGAFHSLLTFGLVLFAVIFLGIGTFTVLAFQPPVPSGCA